MKTASQEREFPARCIPAQLLSLTGRQAEEKRGGERQTDRFRGRKTSKQQCRQVEKDATKEDHADVHSGLFRKNADKFVFHMQRKKMNNKT